MRIGVECGGTFTDLIMLADDGQVLGTTKVFSTPDDPSRGVLEALDHLERKVPAASNADSLLHGSTVATNAILERRGPRLGLLVTAGFRDLLLLARHDRDSTFDLHYRKPEPLLRRADVREVDERLASDGTVLADVDPQSVREAVGELVSNGVEALAVALLHSYHNDVHERLVRDIIEEVSPQLSVSLSSDVAPEFREYERTNTTTVDAFIRPTIEGYVSRLSAAATSRGLNEVAMMQSSGGIAPLELIAAHPLQVLLSGPAAGVAGAIASARSAGIDDLVTLDMGGTSTDVCLVTGGEPARATETRIDRRPIRLPMVDIATVGAGGGSIVGVDSGGMMRVGPRSVGADPGPASYARGGTAPTVTDAHVLRGLIRPGHFAVSDLVLQQAPAAQVFEDIAGQVNRPVQVVAEDAFRIANVTMAGAIKLVSVERGIEPRGHTLVAFGGAGPIHAASVADEIGMTRVLIPAAAGILSAYGLLAADFRHEVSNTSIHGLRDLSPAMLAKLLENLRTRAEDDLVTLGQDAEGLTVQYLVDMRYRGQGFELTVPLPRIPDHDDDSLAWVAEIFHDAHKVRYGHSSPDKPVEVVTQRLVLTRPSTTQSAPRSAAQGPVKRETGTVALGGERTACEFLWRESLPVGFATDGPAVIEEGTTTTFVPPGWECAVDEQTNLVLTKGARDAE